MFRLSYIIHLSIYWLYSLFWYCFSKSETRNNFDRKKGIEVAKNVLYIQLTLLPVFSLPFIFFYDLYLPKNLKIIEIITEPLVKFPLMSLWEDILFYHIHRFFHTPKYYKYHKLHHSWKSPVPWGAMYASNTENVLVNFLPVLTAPLVVSLNIYFLPVWIFSVTISSVLAHNGDGKHDLHHQTFKGNYGTMGVCDWLYQTEEK